MKVLVLNPVCVSFVLWTLEFLSLKNLKSKKNYFRQDLDFQSSFVNRYLNNNQASSIVCRPSLGPN